jgi:hypothetical protein
MSDLIYRDVWDYIDKSFDIRAVIRSDWQAAVRGDYRGYIVCPDDGLFGKAVDQFDALIDPEMPKQFENDYESIRRMLLEKKSFFTTILAVGASRHPIFGYQPDIRWDSNHIFCVIVDGAAYYGSNIDLEHSIEDGNSDGRVSRHFILIDGINKDRIGRLVRRVNILSELRAMAFVDRIKITKFGSNIRELGNKLSIEFDGLAKAMRPNMSFKRMNEIVRKYNDMGRSKWTGNQPVDILMNRPHGGLLYRSYRSEYYFNALLMRIEDLGEKSIDGSQSYSAFVRRNYKQPIESIKSVAERYKQLGVRIDRMISVAHTLQQRKITMYGILTAVTLAWVPLFVALRGLGQAHQDWVDEAHVDVFASATAFIAVIAVVIGLKTIWKRRRLDISEE